ncbi:MAG: Transcriptional regulator GlxA family [Verrucomicrobia bacterium]|nr:MAG: Transcriptional regulator GlxA family [Verrucomicrobiota bacterium]
MRNATPLKPLHRPVRSGDAVREWEELRATWLDSLDHTKGFAKLFDCIPGVHFFAKNREGHVMFASQSLLERYSMSDESEILGRTDFDLNPGSMAQAYVTDDRLILSGTAAVLERIELWWDRQGLPDWFLVTKLALRDRAGAIQGVMGLLRRPDEAERRLPTFQTVAEAVSIIRGDFAKPLRIAEVASACGQSLRQLQRRFQDVFGITPQEFLIRTRVLAAARLLEQSSLSSAEIASQCGFPDQSRFAQHFKKRIGFSPLGYRGRSGT